MILNSNPAFRKLLKLRSRVRFTLAALLVLVHAFFVGGIAFYNDLFARPLQDGGTLTIGILAAVVVIIAMVLLEWVYIFISEKWLDPMQQKVLSGEHND
ncbi:MAG: DUF485 domain-containing protein [Arenicella sp.]|nr:DUF485 domain-containing protein [Arenicella sp.]